VPEGTWDITGEGFSDQADVGPYISGISYGVSTYAQDTMTGAWVDAGEQTLPDAWIHGSDFAGATGGANSYTDRTYGCIRMRNQDINAIRSFVRQALTTGGDASIAVRRSHSFSRPSLWRRGHGLSYLGRN